MTIPREAPEAASIGEVMTLERLHQFGEAWARADLDALMGYITDDCVYLASVGADPGTTYRGREEVRHGFAAMLAYDRGRERRGGMVVIAGDVGFAEWSFTEPTADGGHRVIRGCDLFEFRGGKIARKDAFRKVLGTITGTSDRWKERGVTITSSGSRVTAVPPAPAQQARDHFERRLTYETDPADVWNAIQAGTVDFALIDCRLRASYDKAHLPDAISLPVSEIDPARVAALPDGLLVTYCWGPSCNAATKGAYRLAALGRQVKELIGGLEYWIREGHPVEGRRPVERGKGKASDWGLVS
jgi:rhodanese-related sulfurtransferase/ketosteroid isomerase-like protein